MVHTSMVPRVTYAEFPTTLQTFYSFGKVSGIEVMWKRKEVLDHIVMCLECVHHKQDDRHKEQDTKEKHNNGWKPYFLFH